MLATGKDREKTPTFGWGYSLKVMMLRSKRCATQDLTTRWSSNIHGWIWRRGGAASRAHREHPGGAAGHDVSNHHAAAPAHAGAVDHDRGSD